MPRALVALAVSLVLLALLASGCSAEDPAQRYVREQVSARLAALGGYDVERTRCTSTPRPWFVEQRTEVYVCTARRRDGGCDWFRGTLVGREVQVTPDTRNAGCVLPP